jgi:hypothetical protein
MTNHLDPSAKSRYIFFNRGDTLSHVELNVAGRHYTYV